MNATQQDISDLMRHVWKQTPRQGIESTHNHCTTPNCVYSVIGTGPCRRCAINELQDLIGVEDGHRYGRCIEMIRDIENRHISNK